MQTETVYHAPSDTTQSEYSVALPGQKAGIAVGAIGMSSPVNRDHPVS